MSYMALLRADEGSEAEAEARLALVAGMAPCYLVITPGQCYLVITLVAGMTPGQEQGRCTRGDN